MFKRIFLVLILVSLTISGFNQTRDLDYYLNQGRNNSPLLNDYRNQIKSSIADSLLIRAARKPLVGARSFLQYSPVYGNFGYDEVITDGGNYMAVMEVSQNIFNKNEISNKYEAVDLQRQSISNASRISSSELARIITAQYLTLYTSYDDYLFNKNFLSLFYEENEIIKEFVKNGICKQTDYLSLLVETQSQELMVNQLRNQYRKELMFLNQLCGLNDSSLYELVAPQIDITGIPEIDKTPSYIQYKIDSVKIENEKMAIDIRYKPKVSWFADAGILTHDPFNFYKHVGYSAGLSLDIPIYDGKQKELEKQKLEFSENTRSAYENNFRLQYSQQLSQLNDELRSLNEMSDNITKQLKTSDLLVRTLKRQLESGIIEMTEYINALKNYRTTSRNLNLINIQKLHVINEMNFLATQ
jgi:outer membrane protein TolC